MSQSTSNKKTSWSLRRRLVAGVLAYLVLLTVGVLANDYIVNERAENLVWETLLDAELSHFLERRAQQPEYQWYPTETLELFEFSTKDGSQPDLDHLTPGVHDEIMVNGIERVVLVRDQDATRFVLALDISDLEAREAEFRRTVFLSALASVIALGLLAAWGVERVSRPLRQLAGQIRGLDPEGAHKRVQIPENSSAEVILIADAMNAYSSDLEQYIAREREFVATASHELRTPLAVIAGAVDIAASDPSVSAPIQGRLRMAQHTIEDVRELIELLLALAKNPERLSEANETVSLQQLLPEIVEEYGSMADGKGLRVELHTTTPGSFLAPVPLVRSAIGNLIRNAIEATHAGTIYIGMENASTVVIENPTPRSHPEELAALYTRLARGSSSDGGGIGLSLIAKLCRHCGWNLAISDARSNGVRFSLSFRNA